jgi:GAF domain-containing protein
MTAPILANEPERLEALHSFGILDTCPEDEFDAITRVAAHVCGTPIAMISLVDETRQWFKSKIGVQMTETPRNLSFCAHAIAQSAPLVVPDAHKDPRFSSSPLVRHDPQIRFYCGMPLQSEGLGLGSFCVIDTVPRELTSAQMQILAVLRDAVVTRLQLRRALRLLDDYRHHTARLSIQ